MKKRINAILLIIVAALWSTVIYKYVRQYFNTDEPIAFTTNTNSNVNKIKAKENFSLNPIERDPFLNQMQSNRIVSKPIKIKQTHKNNTTAIIKPITTTQKPFPSIIYLGYIKSDNQKNELILVKVNGALQKIYNNETKNGIKVKKNQKDTIAVTFQNTTKKFSLKSK
jgi:hypothetical protein